MNTHAHVAEVELAQAVDEESLEPLCVEQLEMVGGGQAVINTL